MNILLELKNKRTVMDSIQSIRLDYPDLEFLPYQQNLIHYLYLLPTTEILSISFKLHPDYCEWNFTFKPLEDPQKSLDEAFQYLNDDSVDIELDLSSKEQFTIKLIA